jgi:hypothetical protein
MVPQLKDPTLPRESTALTSFQWMDEPEPSHAVADSRYRLIRYGTGFEELYDLETDPNEFTNRIDDPALSEVRKRLSASLPKDAAAQVGPATDSPYNRQPTKTSKANQPIANVVFRISAKASPKSGADSNGVLASHGGDHHGYALHVAEGKPSFSVRRNRKIYTIASKEGAPGEPFTLEGRLQKDGHMLLFLNAEKVAEGDAGGLIGANPNESFAKGSDPLSPVGDYASPNPYDGIISEIQFAPLQKKPQ